ncbi:MAG TPA: hypothetical protein VGO64_02090, partial [Candidatus Limnocylindrales bacterium]|nr:hypothetical protein [Candidatus Limnocylindrales bacterium]
MAQDVLEENFQRDGCATEIDPTIEGGEPPDVRQAGAEACSGTKGIGSDHTFSSWAIGTLGAWKSTATLAAGPQSRAREASTRTLPDEGVGSPRRA